MTQNAACSCGADIVGIFPCAGASNVGQLSNAIAVELHKKGTGNMMCTVGIGGKRSGLLKSAEACESIIVIDGCPVNCAKATMEEAGIPIGKHILLTDMDIKKNKELDLDPEKVQEVLSKVEEML
ncbi:putative zinc-binding protein [Methanolobus bombayensis]|uniref:putative zinc-binding protein n=1 Tax=Methanolobus bombayensis TaxID=38023 RepID=UPI001AEA0722|nr:putative zinc-binding protein [Methanolobus bombayensis]MBP1909966.1 putative metal-binding protein [Methanolobus bombayensis]